MNGTAPGEFSPDAEVTRAQAVKFVVRARGLSMRGPWSRTYTDVSPHSPYFADVEAARRAGLLEEMAPSAGSFAPSAPMSRGDFAVLATNALNDGGLAASMGSNRRTYGYLHDLGLVPPADLGAANAMMRTGACRRSPRGGTRRSPTETARSSPWRSCACAHLGSRR